MIDEIQKCVDAKVNFFDQYYTIPQEVQGEVDAFISETSLLGNSCNSATEFEEKFVSSGLSAKFTAILPKCTPKSVKMTKEQKQYSRKVAKEIIMENKDELIVDNILEHVETDIRVGVRGYVARESRERMIEDGTFAEHTITKNIIEDTGRLAGFLKNKFKKKK